MIPDSIDERFSRNIGIFSEHEQKKLANVSIAIAGAGGVGGLLAERLVRIGVGKIKLTDPGTFEHSNCNRQYACNEMTINGFKAKIVSEDIQRINPGADIIFDTKGIHTQEDADEFVEGADIIIDEMDYGLFNQSIALQRAARNNGKYYMFSSAIGFGGLAVLFAPKSCTLEEFNGLEPDKELSEITQPSLDPQKVLPMIPGYLKKSEQLMMEIIREERPVTTNSIGVGVTSIITANEAINLILKKAKIITAPEYIYIDLVDGIFKRGSNIS